MVTASPIASREMAESSTPRRWLARRRLTPSQINDPQKNRLELRWTRKLASSLAAAAAGRQRRNPGTQPRLSDPHVRDAELPGYDLVAGKLIPCTQPSRIVQQTLRVST